MFPSFPSNLNNERNSVMKKSLNQVIKGMRVENWEVRENSNGKRKVFVRFVENVPAVTVKVDDTI